MRLDLRLVTELQDTFRSNRVRSMYNVEPGAASTHEIHADVPIEDAHSEGLEAVGGDPLAEIAEAPAGGHHWKVYWATGA